MQTIKIPEFEEYILEHGIWTGNKPWDEVSEQMIRDYYGIIPTEILAKKLDRSIKSIQDKAGAMGVKAEDNRKRRESISNQ